MLEIKDLTPEDIAMLFPFIPPEHREETAYRFTEYMRLVARIFDRMEREGKVPKTLHRLVEKRRRRMKRKGLL
jgi:hypothetical protein